MILCKTVSQVLLSGVLFNVNVQEIQNIPDSSKEAVEFGFGKRA